MSITLTYSGTTLTLNPDLFWADENNYTPVRQESEPTLTGAMVVQAGAMVAGRPITLAPEDERSGWMPFSVVQQLRNWAAVPLRQMTLTIRGVSRTVIFRHQEGGGGFEATPVAHRQDVDADDPYLCTLRLMEI